MLHFCRFVLVFTRLFLLCFIFAGCFCFQFLQVTSTVGFYRLLLFVLYWQDTFTLFCFPGLLLLCCVFMGYFDLVLFSWVTLTLFCFHRLLQLCFVSVGYSCFVLLSHVTSALFCFRGLYLLCFVFMGYYCFVLFLWVISRFRFRFFIHQVLQGKCLESGKHTNLSKQQHWHTSTSNPFALTKQHPNTHTHTCAHTHIHTPARACFRSSTCGMNTVWLKWTTSEY